MTDQNQNFFDQYQDDAVEDANIDTGSRLDLPFPYLRLDWKNGTKNLAQRAHDESDVNVYGGWYSAVEYGYQSVAEVNNGTPDCLSLNQIYPDKKEPFEALQGRLVYVAYIAAREGWFMSPKGSKYSILDVLTLLGEYDNTKKIFVPWGPVVLHASGNVAKHTKIAFKEWRIKTAQARQEFASTPNLPNGFPANNFFFPIGTFDDFHHIEVGSGNETSFVTPPRMKEPQKLDFELFKMLFIGHDREMLQTVREYKELAEPWIEDMKVQVQRSEQSTKERDAVGAARYAPAQHAEPAQQHQPAPPEEDEIPF